MQIQENCMIFCLFVEMNQVKAQIPNLFTLGNLFCGCLALTFIAKGQLHYAAYLVGLAAFLDFFDGFFARLLKVSGELGKQLDSLADMVSFGLVPGYLMFTIIDQAMLRNWVLQNPGSLEYNQPENYLPYLAFIITLMSAYRLAKFNIDTRQTHSFIGLPTPANAIFFCSFPLIQQMWQPVYKVIEADPNIPDSRSQFVEIQNQGWLLESMNSIIAYDVQLLIAFTLLFSYLLISELPLFALKFKTFAIKDNLVRYTFVVLLLVLLIIFQFLAIPFIVFLYILLSILNHYIFKQ